MRLFSPRVDVNTIHFKYGLIGLSCLVIIIIGFWLTGGFDGRKLSQLTQEEFLKMAIHEFQKAIQQDSSKVGGYQGLAGAYQLQGDSASAEQVWRDAIKANGEAAWPYTNLAILLVEQRRIPESYDLLASAINQDPTSPHVIRALNKLYTNPNGIGSSAELLAQTANLYQTWAERRFFGAEFLAQDDVDANVDTEEEEITLSDEQLTAQRAQLALLMLRWARKYASSYSSAEMLRVLEGLQKQYPSAILSEVLGDLYHEQSEDDVALQHYALSAKTRDSLNLQIKIATLSESMGDCGRATAAQDTAQQLGALNVEQQISFGRLYLACQRTRDGLALWEQALLSEPQRAKELEQFTQAWLRADEIAPVRSTLLMLKRFYAAGEYANHLLTLTVLAAKTENCPLAKEWSVEVEAALLTAKQWADLGQAQGSCSDWEKSAQSYERALRESAETSQAVVLRAAEATRLTNPTYAQTLYHQLADLGEGLTKVQAQRQLVAFYLGQNACSQAVSLLDSLFTASRLQNDVTLYDEIGTGYLQCQAYQKAVAVFQASLRTRPERIFSRFKLGEAWEGLGDLAQAQEAYLWIINRPKPSDPAQENLYQRAAEKVRNWDENSVTPIATP